ncbi:sulfatase [candidate division KSB1 bacterium 4572_119]|nr:MAG: sulfatase [candidate division KSB1 bacterium 4572_119]
MKKIKITRRDFLKTTALSTLAAGSPATFFSCSRPRKLPNILYIMTDDHAYQAISCYGSKINQTPNIDRLASGGVRFVNSFCTNSICAPSRAVLLTGKYSHLNGVTDNRDKFDAAQQTFPKLLQENGYETALFGKWHLKCDPTGFDYWNILPGQGQYYNPDLIEMGEQKQVKGYATNIITDNCLNWLRNRKSVKPFCALLHHKAPHRNWMPDLKHLSMYEDEEIPIPETFFDDYETRCAAAREQEMRIADDTFMTFDLKVKPKEGRLPENEREKIDARIWETAYSRFTEEQREEWDRAYDPRNEKFYKSNLKGKELDKWKYQRYIKDYLRTIASVDDNIGRVLDYLDETGLAKNTIVVYTSDQGFYLGEHGWFDKRFMYEQSLRMPLIIRYPREIKPGVNESDMVQNIDFAPTFLDYAGIGVPDDIQGRSLRSVLQGVTPDDWRQSIYYHYYGYPAWHMVKKHYGVRTHQYKLIHFYDDIDAWELYDLENDPHELNNVYDNPQYSKIVNELKIELKRLREKYKDTNNPEF